jgi:hypothetical protein
MAADLDGTTCLLGVTTTAARLSSRGSMWRSEMGRNAVPRQTSIESGRTSASYVTGTVYPMARHRIASAADFDRASCFDAFAVRGKAGFRQS